MEVVVKLPDNFKIQPQLVLEALIAFMEEKSRIYERAVQEFEAKHGLKLEEAEKTMMKGVGPTYEDHLFWMDYEEALAARLAKETYMKMLETLKREAICYVKS